MARIMIVDDALFMRQMLGKILIGGGHEICAEASNAKEAVEKYKQAKPDLVTVDIVMPMMEELDGIGAIREIIEFDPKARIVVVSAMGQHSLVAEAIRAGAKDFVNKPVNSARLIETINTILQQ